MGESMERVPLLLNIEHFEGFLLDFTHTFDNKTFIYHSQPE